MYELRLNYNIVAKAQKVCDFAPIVKEWLLLNPGKPAFGDLHMEIREIKKEESKG